MTVRRIPAEIYTSNVYLISFQEEKDVWLVDIGNAKPVFDALQVGQTVKGVFLTHAHYDHIQGINDLERAFPQCMFYCSDHTRDALYSAKLNLSFYHEQPIIYSGSQLAILKDGDLVILNEKAAMKVIATPGHNPGCLTFKLDHYLFTGDSFIPGIPVVTKLKGGSKADSQFSLGKLQQEASEGAVICPGHGEVITLNAAQISVLF